MITSLHLQCLILLFRFDLSGGSVRVILPETFEVYCDTLEVSYLPVSDNSIEKSPSSDMVVAVDMVPFLGAAPSVPREVESLSYSFGSSTFYQLEVSSAAVVGQHLPSSDYGLSWLINTPEVTPEPNNLTIAIVDQYGRVQDAAMTIPSDDHFLPWIVSPPCSGSKVEYGTPITASYRVIFQHDTVSSNEPDDGTLSTTTLSTAALTEVIFSHES